MAQESPSSLKSAAQASLLLAVSRSGTSPALTHRKGGDLLRAIVPDDVVTEASSQHELFSEIDAVTHHEPFSEVESDAVTHHEPFSELDSEEDNALANARARAAAAEARDWGS